VTSSWFFFIHTDIYTGLAGVQAGVPSVAQGASVPLRHGTVPITSFMNINFGSSISAVPVGSSHCVWYHLLVDGSERRRKCLNTMFVEKRSNPSTFQQYNPDGVAALSLQWIGYWLGETRFDFLFSKMSSQPLRPNQASIQRVTGLPPGVKRLGV